MKNKTPTDEFKTLTKHSILMSKPKPKIQKTETKLNILV